MLIERQAVRSAESMGGAFKPAHDSKSTRLQFSCNSAILISFDEDDRTVAIRTKSIDTRNIMLRLKSFAINILSYITIMNIDTIIITLTSLRHHAVALSSISSTSLSKLKSLYSFLANHQHPQQ